ncbi:MAG: YceI family protein [Pyrinomonadaceae bacterium]|nr:YceI family protein [Pyrinomonadaceae bacterium]MCX7640973.1 YceI family protein [Pyrinomonadaceae bacterium]
MKRLLSCFLFAILLSTYSQNFKVEAEKPLEDDPTFSGTYTFDQAHTAIGFRVKHLGLVEVPGYFRNFTGTIKYDAKDISKSSVEFSAKTASIDTGVEARDGHLRSADFFDVEKYPEMTFKSTKVEKLANGYQITGDLTIKGVTKQISFPFQITGILPKNQRSTERMGVVAETKINRRDFGITYGGNLPNGTPMISDEVKIYLQIEATKQ